MKTFETYWLIALFLIGVVLITGCSQSEDPIAPKEPLVYADKPSLQKSGDNSGYAGCVPAPSGLISWWDADVVDQSANSTFDIQDGNAGNMVGGVGLVPGKVDNAFELDGVNAYVNVPDSDNLEELTDLTINAWIRPNDFARQQHIVDKYPRYLFFISEKLWGSYAVSGRASWYWIRSDEPLINFISSDGWVHVAFTHTLSGHVRKLYINGNEVSSQAGVGMTGLGRNDLSIGQHFNGGSHFDGRIDEVGIFNRALTADEIADIYNAGSAGMCKEVTICHKPGTPAERTLVIPIRALQGHLVHGDTIGPCE